jgi:aryl-alcohol dehydrogenase-like predicted oxidoreductase
MAKNGFATTEGTRRYACRFPSAAADHFRQAQGLTLSSIGIGTYLGEPTPAADEGYAKAIELTVRSGCNVIDSAVNYRFQRSERSIAPALNSLFSNGVARDELVLCTKGGYIPFDGDYPRAPGRWIEDNIIVDGSHCMTPRYLKDQLSRSLSNMQVDTVDVYYVHNPESQLDHVSKDEFYGRLQSAFAALEEEVTAGRIRFYGTATWGGFREPAGSGGLMLLEKVVDAARVVAGDDHHCRFVQLPVNLAMGEAFGISNQTVGGEAMSLVRAANRLGVTVIASGSMLQGRLTSGMPPELTDVIGPDLADDASRAIQFARSVPGVTTALVGMGNPDHVRANLNLTGVSPMNLQEFGRIFSK